MHNEMTLKGVLDMLTLPRAALFLPCVFLEQKQTDVKNGSLYKPLQPKEANAPYERNENVTPLAKVGVIKKFTFWWLNPLLNKGKIKVLDDVDISKLRQEDRAEACYSRLMEKLERKEKNVHGASILSTLFIWQRKKLVITGFFALIKVFSLASGPLFLRAFIRVCEGKQSFEHEGYVLALGLFLAKCVESVSERQLKFRTRVIGFQVKSMLCAAIYQKQLRISNAAKMSYSPGQIMNYATVDTNRIGEFPFWFHQIWMISLQICLAMLIIYYSVGLATFAALLAIILMVAGNVPLGRLQQKHLTKLMLAQDQTLKAIAEAVTNMKVLKLYAWETRFRKTAKKYRKEETKWLSAVISQRGSYLVASFWACYGLGIRLDTSNIFTFLATIRIIQESIRRTPDVAAVFIEAKVALTQILKFLEAPELQKALKNRVNEEMCDNQIQNDFME